MNLDPEKCFFVWVPGRGSPKRVYATIEEARVAVAALKAEGRTREMFILSPVEKFPGRKVIGLKNGQSMNTRRAAEPA